jgi:16S rRNA (cytosine1402-N4)-methyltransferase
MPGHLPVLLDEVLAALEVTAGGRRVLDGTFGGGGHTRAMLEAAADNAVVAFDTDPAAVEGADRVAADFPARFTFVPANFEELGQRVTGTFTGVLLDLGLSSYQFDTPERGFSFRFDAPTDMRLNPEAGMSAAEFLETAPREDLIRAVRVYGEEDRWRAVVDAILKARGTGKLARTLSFAELVSSVIPPPRGRRQVIHPATKTFQGVRIAINRELEVLETVLPAAFRVLAPAGRLAVISFHSLEDRIVKRFFREMAGRPVDRFDHRPQDLRVSHGRELSSRPITPGEAELAANPRSRSAKLRVFVKEPAE